MRPESSSAPIWVGLVTVSAIGWMLYGPMGALITACSYLLASINMYRWTDSRSRYPASPSAPTGSSSFTGPDAPSTTGNGGKTPTSTLSVPGTSTEAAGRGSESGSPTSSAFPPAPDATPTISWPPGSRSSMASAMRELSRTTAPGTSSLDRRWSHIPPGDRPSGSTSNAWVRSGPRSPWHSVTLEPGPISDPVLTDCGQECSTYELRSLYPEDTLTGPPLCFNCGTARIGRTM